MTMQEAQKYLEQVSGWEIFEQDETLRIRKQFKFSTYMSGINFINKIAKLAEEEGHHPNLEVGYAKLTVMLWTHAIDGLSENDFILAAKINRLQSE